MRTRLWIAAMMYPIVNAVLFGVGVIAVLCMPSLAEHAGALIWMVVAVSLVVALPISWVIAPRLRLRYWRGQKTRENPRNGLAA